MSTCHIPSFGEWLKILVGPLVREILFARQSREPFIWFRILCHSRTEPLLAQHFSRKVGNWQHWPTMVAHWLTSSHAIHGSACPKGWRQGVPNESSAHHDIYHYHPGMWVSNVFSHVCLSVCVSVCVSVCLSVCLSVCSGYNFLTPWYRNFIFSMQIYLEHI